MPNGMTILFFISAIVGIILVVISLILGVKRTEEIEMNQLDSTTEKQNELIKVIEDADDAIEQLNSVSKSIFEEQEQKYQELLYLYQIIDDKKQELLNIFDKITSIESKRDLNEDIKEESFKVTDINNKNDKEDENGFTVTDSKHNEIIDLYNSGHTVTQIAQQLNMGQGEVSLIIELNKRGENITHE